jgi:hypothetical protein
LILVWAAVLDLREVYAHVRDTLIPAIPKTTLNMWSSDVGFDTLVADPVGLQRHGVGESMQNVPIQKHVLICTGFQSRHRQRLDQANLLDRRSDHPVLAP